MPRYFFDICGDCADTDCDGVELADVAAAKIVAASLAACLLKEDPKRFWCDGGWHLFVRAERGDPLFEIAFFMNLTPEQSPRLPNPHAFRSRGNSSGDPDGDASIASEDTPIFAAPAVSASVWRR